MNLFFHYPLSSTYFVHRKKSSSEVLMTLPSRVEKIMNLHGCSLVAQSDDKTTCCFTHRDLSMELKGMEAVREGEKGL